MTEKITNITITSTTNYDQFKVVNSNRTIKQRNVEKLMKSFELTKGMSKSKPIIVDGNYNVIDGQHRLMACKKMGIPVHYVVTEDTIDSIPIFNTYQEKWGIEDYVIYYANKGNENYIRLLEVKRRAGVSINACLECLGFATSKTSNFALKEGRFVFEEDIDKSVEHIEKVMRLCYVIKGKRNVSTKITRAIRTLSKIRTFNLDAFIEKITRYQGKLYNCTTSDEYIDMFVSINNYKLRLENRLSPSAVLEAQNS